MDRKQLKKAMKAARGLQRAELVIKNANVINVFSGEIRRQDIAIEDGVIVGTGVYHGEREIDLKGMYVMPGFIDSHLHLESTLVTPSELIHQAVKCGTTTFIVDPHESANVAGTDGIDYILEQTEQVPANVYVMMPSCVPATGVDDNGCCLTAEKMSEYHGHKRILGLGEVMDYRSVVEGKPEMLEKLGLFRDKVLDGHAPFLSPGDLSAYSLAGIGTDHECVDYEYAMEEIRNGMYVLIREGSAARNLQALVTGIVEHQTDTGHFCFCTDDKHIEDILREGHISHNVREAIRLGIPPVKAIRMATLQAAECYHLRHLGAVAPGYQADLIVVSDLEQMKVERVFYKGQEVEEDPTLSPAACADKLKHTVHVKPLCEKDLWMHRTGRRQPVIRMVGKEIITREEWAVLPGGIFFEPDETCNKVAVIERHKATGRIGKAAVMGYGIHGGAIASSVSHDSHNLVVIGDNDRDMLIAAEELIRCQGGYTIVKEGKAVETLPLPIMGLMTDEGFRTVQKKLEKMIRLAHEMGVEKEVEPFIALSFLALPVLPEIRILPRGLYRVEDGSFYREDEEQ